MTFWTNLRWAIFGAVLGAIVGNFSATATNDGLHQLDQLICPGERLLAEGMTLREQAIDEHNIAKHHDANARFESAIACGNTPEAVALLGQAYCYPDWGMTPNRDKGMRMIHDAYWRGARLPPDWFTDKDVCPPSK